MKNLLIFLSALAVIAIGFAVHMNILTDVGFVFAGVVAGHAYLTPIIDKIKEDAPGRFIKRKMKMLAKKFPEISMRYEHQMGFGGDDHLIEVSPKEIFESEEFTNESWTCVQDEFIHRWMCSSILFISSEDDMLTMKEPTYELKGRLAA